MMEKMKKLIPAVAAALLFQVGAEAQNWQQVHKLYHAGMYSEAVRLVGNAQGQDADAYRALCALGMRADNAQTLALAFVGRNGEHVLAPQVRFGLGQLLFDQGAYEEALKQFEKCKGLYPDQEAERLYKMGFSAYSTGEWDFAATFLAKVKGQPYEAPAQYTLGYMDYARRCFKDAIGHLQTAAKDPRFKALSQYYILECR
jgi:tetratricopeptide (TPR) repeat protein